MNINLVNTETGSEPISEVDIEGVKFWQKRYSAKSIFKRPVFLEGHALSKSGVAWSPAIRFNNLIYSANAPFNEIYRTDSLHLLLTSLATVLESTLGIVSSELPTAVVSVSMLGDICKNKIETDTPGTARLCFPLLLPVAIQDFGERLLRTKSEFVAILSHLHNLAAADNFIKEEGEASRISAGGPGILVRLSIDRSDVAPSELDDNDYWLIIDISGLDGCPVLKVGGGHLDIVALADKIYLNLIRQDAKILSHFNSVGAVLPPNSSRATQPMEHLRQFLTRYPDLQDIYPATEMQRGMLSFSGIEKHSGSYAVQAILSMGPVNSNALKQAIEILIERHDALRTLFEKGMHGELLQLVLMKQPIDWREARLPSADEGDATGSVSALAEEERVKQFDSGRSPYRFLFISLADGCNILVWTYHHALLDGWSLNLLLGELQNVYSGRLLNQKPNELSTPVPFKNYIAWLSDQQVETAESYWRNYLKGFKAPTQISFAKANTEQVYVQEMISDTLSAETSGRLYHLCVAEQFTPNTIVQLAWAILLSKFSRENDVLFGYAVSGRAGAAELDGIVELVGMCLNALPMRLKLSGENSIRQLLNGVQNQLEFASDYEFLSLDKIGKLGDIPKSERLFDTFVTTENLPLAKGDQNNSLDIREIKTLGHNNFGLNLIVHPGEAVRLDLVYNTASYSDVDARTILNSYAQILSDIAFAIDRPLADIKALSRCQLQELQRQNELTRYDYKAETIWDRFLAVSRRNTHRVALVHEGKTWTYATLRERAYCLASNWINAGIEPGEYVAIALPKSMDFIAAILSLHALGCAYVPLGTQQPETRCAHILTDAGIRWLITDSKHLVKFSSLPCNCLDLSDVSEKTEYRLQPEPRQDVETPAYVIYTSGTTGTPKGVVITHKNIANFCSWVAREGLIAEQTRVTQFAPMTFDASAGEIFSSLWIGAELHILSDDLTKDPLAVGKYLQSNQIAFSAFPPEYLNEMQPESVDKHSVVLTAGASPSRHLVDSWSKACRYINAYGPTETTVLSSFCYGDRIQSDAFISIGSPIDNSSIYVVDQFGQQCADSVIGEIWIGGDGVAQGYLNLSSLNNEKYIKNYFTGKGRIYKTGDLGRRHPDGHVEVIGRADDQVKIRGYRIELGEVESVYARHLDVEQVRVVARKDAAQSTVLALYLILKNAGNRVAKDAQGQPNTLSHTKLIRAFKYFGRMHLPDYMVPAHIFFIDAFPLNPNGKLDQEKLPSPSSVSVSNEVYVPASNEIEHMLVDSWSKVLCIDKDQVGMHDNFFEIGGDSLKVMTLVKQLSSTLDIEIAPAKIFRYPSIDLFAQYLRSSMKETTTTYSAAIHNGKARMRQLKRKKTREDKGVNA